ncbi:Uncharacterised protein [Bordetella pertussis]|nr:Uncharacterised protein [Bordetella pertussis]
MTTRASLSRPRLLRAYSFLSSKVKKAGLTLTR